MFPTLALQLPKFFRSSSWEQFANSFYNIEIAADMDLAGVIELSTLAHHCSLPDAPMGTTCVQPTTHAHCLVRPGIFRLHNEGRHIIVQHLQ